MRNRTNIFIVIVILSLVIFVQFKKTQYVENTNGRDQLVANNPNCIPTFLDGGGPYYEPNSPFREKISPDNHQGVELTVKGKVLASDCVSPLGGLVLDIWQANESGNYEDVWYRGRVKTSQDGSYQFTTVIPKGYGEGTAFRPPHIHFKVWKDNQLIITSQMFLPQSREQGIKDAYIMKLTQLEDGSFIGDHSIILP